MATTTNYGWTTPDDTALVKDGASAIRTLGSSVDTTTKNLNPETTLGDISFRSSTSNVNTRLGIGTTGQVLNVSGGVPAWTTISSGGMTLITTTTFDNTASTYTYSSLGSYKHLFIVIQGIQSANGSLDTLNMRYNSDATTNYVTAGFGNNTGTYDNFNLYQSSVRLAWRGVPETTQVVPYLGEISAWILDYAGSGYKSGYSQSYAGLDRSFFHNHAWGNTAAITSLTLLTNSGSNFKTGILKLYGVS